ALDHAVKAKMDIKPRDKFDMEVHRQKLVKRVEDIREGHQKEHAKQVEEAARSDDNLVDSQSLIEQADCPGGNCPEEAAAPTAGGDEEAIGEENKEPVGELGSGARGQVSLATLSTVVIIHLLSPVREATIRRLERSTNPAHISLSGMILRRIK
ncbi:hypothetical protein FOZ62_020943, partial [Perkinsus olseni]